MRQNLAFPLKSKVRNYSQPEIEEAIREGDYSIRARHARGEDALGEVMQQMKPANPTPEQLIDAIGALVKLEVDGKVCHSIRQLKTARMGVLSDALRAAIGRYNSEAGTMVVEKRPNFRGAA